MGLGFEEESSSKITAITSSTTSSATDTHRRPSYTEVEEKIKSLQIDGGSSEEKAMQRKQRLQLLRLQAEQRVKGKREQQSRDDK